MRPRLLVLLAAALAACGDESSRARALAETVGREVAAECEKAPAPPDEAGRRHLRRLCACRGAKVAATPMRFGESDRSIGEKVRAATRACAAELGAAPRGRGS